MARPGRFSHLRVKKPVLWLSAAALIALAGLASAAWRRGIRAQHERETGALTRPATRVLNAPLEPTSVDDQQGKPRSAATTFEETPVNHVSAPPASAPNTTAALASASALFRKASSLRTEGQLDAAIATFLKLQKLFPESREGRLSLVITGRLLLDRGHPARALDEFDRYLAGHGAASEDALAGRATALQGLGHSEDEARAWQSLLTAYPKSVYEKRARARLAELRPAQVGPPDPSGTP